MHSQGRQGSHYKVELLPFGSGVAGSSSGKIVERLSPDDALEGVELLARSCRIMYESEGVIHFIDQETMEEVECTVDSLEGGETSLKMITEDMDVIIQSLEDDPSRVVSVKLPLSGVYRVQHTDPSPSMVSNEGRGMYSFCDFGCPF
ncbi:hypothetical protein BDR26DRAFT_578159 [Obelidium mucronatum]|nr:hypothetical protein BDR26DRAFT_578159 [Obelidium mucronatum]